MPHTYAACAQIDGGAIYGDSSYTGSVSMQLSGSTFSDCVAKASDWVAQKGSISAARVMRRGGRGT